jgi:molybdate transport system substrate-binding protein
MRRAGVVAAAACLAAGLALAAWLVFAPRAPEPPAGKRQVRVAAAADLKFALEDLVQAFGERHPQIEAKVTYGASGSLFAQLNNRAPFDLFLSADIEYPRKLAEQGLADRDSEFLYAVGHLVVWVPNSSRVDVEKLGIKALLDPSIKKVAIANPRTAPYGRGAEAALKSLGVYDDVKDKLVLGENIAQTAQFVQTGSADAGVIALSLALAPPMRDQGRYWEVPLDAYPRLEQGGVILSWAQDRQAAAELRSFLLGAEGRAVLKRYGFVLPGE